ncbi:hypothetical protein BVC80_8617g17 [Macleaya cordata]|uniref:RNase H type-1 domain-containing protein n=1 Tax=Macleaya cordata TaxID=56857 RepID=A0A200PTF7_MACCD|nr:hypothetical protein BVC80_8617g17 [Macleaya cordata]
MCSSNQQQTLVVHWSFPDNGVVKFNTDASFKSVDLISGLGIILRDETGFCKGGKSITTWACSAEHAEGLAILSAVKWAQELGYKQVMFEGDSQSIMYYLNGKASGLGLGWRTKNLLDEGLSIAKHFLSCKFAFVNRAANQVADCLAKKACNGGESDVWISDPPSYIFDVLNRELYAVSSSMGPSQPSNI